MAMRPPSRRVACSTALAWLVLAAVLSLPLLALTRRQTWTVAHERKIAETLHPERHAMRGPATLVFNWTVTLGKRAPDGVEKDVYLVNGAFPGPTIEARSGDRILVDVTNGLEREGVAIHWHGLRVEGHNHMDGAVGFTQCPIAPGQHFVYDIPVGPREHGTFWWHGHSQGQRGDGLYGGLVVHEPSQRAPTEADALLLIGDWFHARQSRVLSRFANHASLGNEPVPDSLLINGRGRFNCSRAVVARPVVCTQLSPADVEPVFGARAASASRLRLVNTGSVAGFHFSVDGASLQPLAVDGGCAVDARPARSVGLLYPGERIDLALRWDASHGEDPSVNIYLDDENFSGFPNAALSPNQSFAALQRADTGSPAEEKRPPRLQLASRHRDLGALSALASSSAVSLPSRAEQTIVLYIKTQKLARFGNRPLGFVNHTTWTPQTPPVLSLNRSSWNNHQLLPFVNYTTQPGTVELVINNLDDGAHPIHIHGHSFHVLSSFRAAGRDGWGSFNPFEAESPSVAYQVNPVVKDTVAVPRRGHVVLRLTADNAGIWMIHCHMLVHMGTGMAAGLHVGPSDDLGHVRDAMLEAAGLCEAPDQPDGNPLTR